MAATQGSGYLYFVSLLLTLVAVVTATSGKFNFYTSENSKKIIKNMVN